MNEDDRQFLISAIKNKAVWNLIYNVEYLDREMIIEYFPEIIDIIGRKESTLKFILSKLNNDEIDICIKKISKFDMERFSDKCYFLWRFIDDNTRENNPEFISKIISKSVEENDVVVLLNVLKTQKKETQIATLTRYIAGLDSLSTVIMDYLERNVGEDVIVEVLKNAQSSDITIVTNLWNGLSKDLKDSIIFEIMDKYDDEIKVSLWSNFSNNDKKVKELVDIYKGKIVLVDLIKQTYNYGLRDNILKIIEENIDDTNTLLYIWAGLDKKKTNYFEQRKGDFEYLKEVQSQLFVKIWSIVKEQPEHMVFMWKIDSEALCEKIPNVFLEILEKVKDDDVLLTDFWINTPPSIQDENKYVFGRLTELVNDIEKIKEIWQKSSHNSKAPMFRKVCRLLLPKSVLDEEQLNEFENAFFSIFEQNHDVAELFPTEFIKFYSKQNLEIFGKDKMIQIACYPQIVKKINSLNYKQIQVIGQCCDRYMQKYNTDEWVYLFNDMLNYIEDFDELISSKESFTDEELDKLCIILQDNNFLGINNYEQLEKIEQIRKEKCDELIKCGKIYDLVEAICISKFGYTKEKLKYFIRKYGVDYEKITNENLRYFLNSIEVLIDYCSNRGDTYNGLQRIYDEVEPVTDFNLRAVERKLKNEYANMYNETLFQISNAVPCKDLGENIYELPKDENGRIQEFSMIVTAIGAFHTRNIDNYYDDWNQNSLASQHFCASYIHKYMLGVITKEGIHFGFSSLEKDSLVMLGAYDLGSLPNGMVSDAYGTINYYSPDKLLDNTMSYSEMDIYRRINEIQKQPDYIVCYKQNGVVANLEKAKMVSKQFEVGCGKALPIIIIDESQIRADAIDIINSKLSEYKSNPSEILEDEIYSIVSRIQNYDKGAIELLFVNEENSKLFEGIRSKKIRQKAFEKSQITIMQSMEEFHAEQKKCEPSQFIEMHEDIYKRIHKEDRDG